MRNTDAQPNALLLYERLGQQVMRLGLGPRETFHAVSAVVGFVIGIAADLGQEPPQEVVDGDVTRDEYIARYADQWRSKDPETYPFLHYVIDEFAAHDDADQFRAGLELLLRGIRSRSAG